MEQIERRSTAPSFAARAAVPLAIVGVMAVAVTLRGGVAPTDPFARDKRLQPSTAAASVARSSTARGTTAQSAACASCGVVESVHTVEAGGFRVRIRMDDGSRRTFSQPVAPGYEVGEKVRIIEGTDASRG